MSDVTTTEDFADYDETITEATAVTPEGRISPEDLGLWNDGQMVQLGHVTDFVHRYGGKIGVQLAHAGRKASTYAPGRGKGWVPEAEGGWIVVGPDGQAKGVEAASFE